MILKSFDYGKYFLFLILFSFPILSFALSPTGNYIFVENKGQWPSEILFKADIPGGYLFVKKTGLDYLFYDSKSLAEAHFGTKNANSARKKPFEIDTQSVSVDFKNSSNLAKIEPLKKQDQVFNYYYGNDASRWVTGANAFEEIWLRNIYDNIDFRLYGIGESLKYEYVVHPNGNPDDIKLNYRGQENITFSNNEIHVKTRVNAFKEFQPFTFQNRSNTKKVIPSYFKLDGHELTFSIDAYDKNTDLIIDPELVFSSYSGSISDNWSHTATFDDNGNLYAGGTVFGPAFPTTPGAVQSDLGGASDNRVVALTTDIVIMKYSSDGKRLLYSTFLGGGQSEVPHSLICDSKGNLVIFGTTSSSNFPVMAEAFQKEFKGGSSPNGGAITSGIGFIFGTDMFVTVINPLGSKLIGSTYVGGTLNDGIHDYRALLIQNYGDEFRGEVYVGSDDDIYVASITSSDDFPIINANSKISSSHDGVVFQLNNSVTTMKWSTYLGGNRYDAAYGIRVNKANEVYILGTTVSSDLRTTPNALQTKRLGESDAFIAKYKNGILQSQTYLGTPREDIGSLIDLDDEGNVYVFGLTLGNYPIKGTVYQNPGSGQFIHSLNPNLTQTRFSTVFGSGNGIGSVDLVPTAFLVNSCGNIYVAGWGGIINTKHGFSPKSSTKGLPITSNAYRSETTGSNYYFGIFEANAKSLLYGTYFGSQAPPNPDDERGDHLDGGTCRFDKNGIIYHSACVCKSLDGFVDFPTENGIQKVHNSSNCNMAAFKFDIGGLNADFNIVDRNRINPETICAGTKVNFDNKSKGGITYQWTLGNTVLSRLEKMNYTFEKAGEYEVKLEAFNNITCAKSDSAFRHIRVIPFDVETSSDTVVCSGNEVNLFAKGGSNYEWSPSELLDNAFIQNPKSSVEKTTTFSVQISNKECSVSKEVEVIIQDDKEDFKVSKNQEICAGDVMELGASGLADYYVWTDPEMIQTMSKSIKVSPLETSIYTVQAFYSDGCKPIKSVYLTIDQSFAPDFDYEIKYHCDRPMEVLFHNESDGNAAYSWNLGNNTNLTSFIPDGYSFKTPGDYVVQLKATNKIGCELISEKNIEIPEADGIIPNAISPNGDGKNETFVVGIPEVQLSVFNRWGKLIYENNSYDNSWGTGAEVGTYFYEIKLPNREKCKGWVDVFH